MSAHKDQIKRDWEAAPYYEVAETSLWPFWAPAQPFLRMFATLDLNNLVDLACGHGRHAAHIREYYRFGHLTLVDINETNIRF
jgi:SAM-dependent methyltransferase